jgi:16S rRNA (guanine966-N2)-methyltransferase
VIRNRVRIVGGMWRSRQLRFPHSADLRPTPDRIRETLFNWLGQQLEGSACLDLFAGSGALGFEAASRGAQHVVMVEHDLRAVRALKESCEGLAATQVEIVRSDAMAFLKSDPRRFDVVFLDPPYRLGLLESLLERLVAHLNPGAKVYLEGASLPQITAPYQVLRQGRAGQVQCLLVQWLADERAP